ncbi:MAG: hypothetical protein U0746_16620 [Gemmataceae bacterium]
MIRAAPLPTAEPVVRKEIVEVTDPAEIASFQAQRAQADKNLVWRAAHLDEVLAHRGKHYCIAGQELFVANSADEAVKAARAKHPDDRGFIVGDVPMNRHLRV